ncbi:sodium/hydrogen exchanger 9B2 isoform X1 [Nerophis ophidion]|uniref:sodium/hydrogen exchanger 9B2 isoform X1 n=1 Tax=Nerophis ophidion TaxID=159077 RepID=UPI002ADFCAF4|nr:sodium/hydrogen exchanger 9B2 isoform X1 [Nerophis ophidion]
MFSCCACFVSLREKCPRPHGLINLLITKACMLALLFGVLWAVTGKECLPGGKVFGIIIIFISAVLGGRLLGLVRLPHLPPIPPLLGMLLAGLVLRNVPYVTDAVAVDAAWSAALRNMALSVILARAGLGLDPAALRRLKAVCVRVAVGPCVMEACLVAVVSHFLLKLPWAWGFMLGFVLAAVSPAVVVPSMLLLQKEGYGTEKGIPTLLMAAGSFDDILAITGFSTCLGVAFSTGCTFCSELAMPGSGLHLVFVCLSGTTWMNVLKGLLEVVGGIVSGLVVGVFLCLFPSVDQEDLVMTRTFFLLAFSIFSVFFTHVIGSSGAGGLCTLVLAFLAAVGWGADKAAVAAMLARCWDVFQPLLFGLIGAEITIATLSISTVGLGIAVIILGLLVRLLATFVLVHCAGFVLKERLFIAIAWLPKATVQAAIGSKALDTARDEGNEAKIQFGLDVLTLAVLAILITAPIGALGIGLAGPRLLTRQVKASETGGGVTSQSVQDPVIFESRL